MSTSTLGRHQRTALSPRIGKRRTSILKLNNITPDKENTDNLAGTHARAGAGGGRKSSLKGMQKRRVSFSATNDLVMFDKHAEASKKVAIKELAPAPIPKYGEARFVFAPPPLYKNRASSGPACGVSACAVAHCVRPC